MLKIKIIQKIIKTISLTGIFTIGIFINDISLILSTLLLLVCFVILEFSFWLEYRILKK